MIDLRRNRYLEPIAHKWLGWVKTYLTTVHASGFLPHEKVGNGKVLYFSSHAEKLKYQCYHKAFQFGRSKREQKYCLDVLDAFWRNLDSIILATPPQMIVFAEQWEKRKSWAWNFINGLGEVLVPYYEAISKKYGGSLVEELGIKTCPYCNRQFIYTFRGRDVNNQERPERPELDHFLPKVDFPLFCLSFYNLIPVCHSCNHVKRESRIGVNPYSTPFRASFVITDKDGHKLSKSKIYHLTKKEIKLDFENATNDEKETIGVLGLDNVYNKHKDYVKELIDKSMAYDEHVRKALVESFQGAGVNPRQVYDFVWGRHLMDAEYEDRPLSKLTRDILEQLEIKR